MEKRIFFDQLNTQKVADQEANVLRAIAVVDRIAKVLKENIANVEIFHLPNFLRLNIENVKTIFDRNFRSI